MIRSKAILFPEEFKKIYFVPMGDFHTGDPAGLGGISPEGKFATKKFDGLIEWFKERPYAYTFLMGDLFDAVTKYSIGDIFKQCYTLGKAKDYLFEKLYPIKNQIIGGFGGNHEKRVYKAVGDCPTEELCNRLDIDYFPNQCAYLFLNVGESRPKKRDKRRPIIYTAFLHHMIGGGRTPGGKLNKVKVLSRMALANIYAGAHIHLKGGWKENYTVPDIRNKKLSYIQQAYLSTGSYMGYADYSIEGMYEKPATGATRVRLNGEPERGKDIHISL